MSIELEYAVKKDIRNNTVLRPADARQRSELYWMVGLGAVVVAMLLLSAWQHTEWLEANMRVEQRRIDQERAWDTNRKLRLNLATYLAPETLAREAERVGLRQPTLNETIVIDRIHQPAAEAGAVVASAR